MARTNVLAVVCDQMRGQAMACAGDPNVSTPNLDRLARTGVRFENAYSTYPVCVPARYSLMTGEYPHSCRIPSIGWRLPASTRTIADEFNDAGYETSYVGKWHLSDSVHNPQQTAPFGGLCPAPVPRELQGGFEHWRGFELRNAHHDTHYWIDDDPTPQAVEGYQTDGLTDLTIEYLRDWRDTDRPFFTVLSVEPPHPPYEAPEADEERWRDREIDLRPNVDFEADRNDSFWAAAPADIDNLRSYYAMIENLDRNVGRLLDTLDNEGLREETTVVFYSDHGDMQGSHGLMQKHWPYEESTRVPLIVSQPGRFVGGCISVPTCTEDWYPTLLGVAGLDSDGSGEDLTPLLNGERETLDRPGVGLELYAECRTTDEIPFDFFGEPWRGFVTERYKYTVKHEPEAGGGVPWQLFDLREDPYELDTRLNDPEYSDIARELHGHLRSHLDDSDDDYVLEAAFGHNEFGRRSA